MRQILAAEPETELPEPRAVEVAVRRRSPGGSFFYVPAPVKIRSQPLHETHLRVYDLDIDDRGAVDQFVRTYGRLGVAQSSFLSPSTLSPFERDWTSQLRQALPDAVQVDYLGFPNGSSNMKSGLMDERNRIRHSKRPEDEAFLWNFESVAEFLHGATLIKDMVTAWRWINEDLRPTVADWKAIIWKVDRKQPPRNKSEAAKFLQDYVDEGLQFFPPGLALRGGLRPAWDVRPASQEEWLPIYPICCLQLANHIFEGARYRTCAKTDCRRHFFRQEGRARSGQHRTKGTELPLFCHSRCANTQVARDRRGSKGARPGRPLG